MNNGHGNKFHFMGSWIPITPQKQFPERSNHIPVPGDILNPVGRSNWQDQLPGIPNGYVQDVSNFNYAAQNFIPVEQMGHMGGYDGNPGVRNRMINHVGGSYFQAMDENIGWNNGASANLVLMQNLLSGNTQVNGLRMRNEIPTPANLSGIRNLGYGMNPNGIPNADVVFRPHVQNMHSQANGCILPNMNSGVSDWRQVDSASVLLANQNRCSGINLAGSTTTIFPNQIPQNGFPVPYNLNLLPTEVDTDSCLNAALQLTEVQSAGIQNSQHSACMNSPINEISRQEKGKQVMSFTEDVPPNFDELLQNLVDSSSAVVSSPVEDKGGSDGEADQLFDLNKTPQQKTPKRRKHRPKVIKEGKPKTPKKPPTPKDSVAKETPNGKRKYVRKKPLNSEQPAEKTAVKSCKRTLNFDSESIGNERQGEVVTQQQNGIVPNSNSESQGVELRIGDDRSHSANSTMLTGRQNIIYPERNQQTPDNGFTSLMNQILAGCIPMPKMAEPAQSALRFQNSQFISNNRDTRNVNYQGIGETALQVRNFCENIDEVRQLTHQNSQSVAQIMSSPSESRGSKREYCPNNKQMQPSNTDERRPWLRNVSSEYGIDNGVLGADDLRMLKRNKIENSNTHATSARHHMVLNSHVVARGGVVNLEKTGFDKSTSGNGYNSGSLAEKMAEAKRRAQAALGAIQKCNNFVPPTPQKNIVGPGQTSPAKRGRPPQEKKESRNNNHQQQLLARTQVQPSMYPFSVDEIIYKLNNLNLYGLEQQALVPYKGHGALVPVEFIKKRKPRPKVDLDPETNRIWNLLMGNTSESLEQTDEEKEKKWDEEREVFRGRADSFIARMHLVQGDRRFSKWKGSVVDSVIGVFLTQNVSDHLSSSAFMCLAARFPKKPITHDCDEINIIVVEPEDKPYTETESKRLAEAVESNSFEEIPLSQDSTDSSVIQGNGGLRSSSGSNSETEDPIIGCTPERKAKDSNFLLHEDNNSISFEDFFNNNINGSPLLNKRPHHDDLSSSSTFTNLINFGNASSITEWETGLLPKALQLEGFETYGEECFSSCSHLTETKDASCSEIRHMTNPGSASSNKLHSTDQKFIGVRESQPSNSQTYQTDSLPNGALVVDTTSATEPVNIVDVSKVTENFLEAATNNQTRPENKMSDQKENKRITKSLATPKKGKAAETERNNAADWDRLRRNIPDNDKIRERSKDTEDSLDYEALRRANVKEISDAIKERGMNNMLAERMKEFLDRIVKDHGSIDLEWDYLLSVRGLGLKSVECVRLLTLHHLAFPVDTNVGRIVVRLGWVPLQPLPESLQLHLLEMYPLLETVQKYLWPRLCKLDQPTLYELHYQMITFGKVFCTKSKPNCNACPMRGDCRHFASAFASARLALPGPEEKGIVSSATPPTSNRKPNMVPNAPPLCLPVNNPRQEAGAHRNLLIPNLPPLCLPVNNPLQEVGAAINNSAPIVEEPASPEPEYHEVLESDMEDFYEDPDEIPTIKLNIEEFTMNLQNYVQQNMEVQAGDLSKALVALNPECASIPAPKLKNYSRLRTEHYVYELPDSHPLLKGMDRREPDDPSPYLLAIWTPGETSGSIQPPEYRCESQTTGKFCNESTCFSCNSVIEANSQTVRGTILIPCRTAMRGSFPLNGTYFQVNEMFADHESSVTPIDVPREWIWKLSRRVVYFGTSVTTIFKGLSTEGIQYCFWRGFVCVRGFDQKSRAPRPLMARLHYPASRITKPKADPKSKPK
ncbi:hypothetical protein ACFE04_001686 [Oxalis oulophora]